MAGGYILDDEAFEAMLKNVKQMIKDSQGMVVHPDGKSVTRIGLTSPGHPAKHKGGTAKSAADLSGGKGSVSVDRDDTAKRVSLRYISEFRRADDMEAALKFWLTNKQSEVETLMEQPTKNDIKGIVKMFKPIQVSLLFEPADGLSVYKGDTTVTKGTFKYSGVPVFVKLMCRKGHDRRPYPHVQTIYPELSSEEVERLLKKDKYVLRRL